MTDEERDREKDSLRERLAEYSHRSWANWMAYLFGKSVMHEDGTVVIPANLVTRWNRQSFCEYRWLPESEKGSDRLEADKILDIVSEYLEKSDD